jgi:hypothetical protein
MTKYVEQLECLNCSQSRAFVLHGDREQRNLGQAEAAMIARRGVLTCGRCGSRSLIRSWSDGVPYATAGRTRRRRRTQLTSVVQES